MAVTSQRSRDGAQRGHVTPLAGCNVTSTLRQRDRYSTLDVAATSYAAGCYALQHDSGHVTALRGVTWQR
eukprot:377219-Rhodomonas_salina.1